MITLDTPILIPSTIIKRDGKTVSFDSDKIEQALGKCFRGLGKTPSVSLSEITQSVVNIVSAKYTHPTVEQVQDTVETVLQSIGEYDAAKRYILYRAEHAKIREKRPIPDEVKQVFSDSAKYFPTPLQQFQFFDKYSRYNYDLGRRETWVETVDRAVAFLFELGGTAIPTETYSEIRQYILEMKALPSMRLLAMAGPAARRTNVAIYNCSALGVDSIDAFVEALIISMSGCGVGFSVEGRYVERFPRIVRQHQSLLLETVVIDDSTEGWANALRTGLEAWFDGYDVRFDYSQIRPAGTPLKVKGGRASGEGPLRVMLDFARARILARQGSYLRPIDAHDIMTSVGNAAVSGGMRRTAMLSLFDFTDTEMLNAKSGDFERENSQRWNANNSIVWPSDLSQTDLLRQMLTMVKDGRGEPGIFNRDAANSTIPKRRQKSEFLTNPCVTGDTWVAVADGRGRMQMLDLVNEGKDIEVFTLKDDKLTIRTMRNPRKTGENVPILRVSFADGTYMRTTVNHKFVLKNGEETEAINLQPNDSIEAMLTFSYKKKGLRGSTKCKYDDLDSYRMLKLGDYYKSEHRFIFSHNTGIYWDGNDYHIHHLDRDGRNNRMSNMNRVTAKEHAQEHLDKMLGANNPAVRLMNDEWRKNVSIAETGLKNGNAKDITNEELQDELIRLTREKGRALLRREYIEIAKEKNWPVYWHGFRQSFLGGDIPQVLNAIAVELNLPIKHYTEVDAERVTDLPTGFESGRTYVDKICEVCGKQFRILLNRRETSTCSHACGSQLSLRNKDRNKWYDALMFAHANKKVVTRESQISAYNDLLYTLNRHPMKKEWVDKCKVMGISPEISRKSSPFRYWEDLVEAAGATNHRVVSVEPDGFEDVYTGTVDDTHTFFGIGCERIDRRGRTEMAYVLSRQCGEIFLRSNQFCNLSIAVARPDDTPADLMHKVRIASIIGTIQSMATYFPGLRHEWKQNCEEERLLGVDITGQMDCPAVQDAQVMRQLRGVAVGTNSYYAKVLGINQSAAVTCVKPSGNSSQLLNCSSGLHARWSEYYVRNVRVSAHSPIYKVMRDTGVPMSPENGQTPDTATAFVAHFPVKSPDGAITRKDRSALEQCEYWLLNKLNWTEHNPSATITYKPDEVIDLIKWVWDHKDVIGGLSFLPATDAQYAQMPYVEITKEEYEKLSAEFPPIDFSKVFYYEASDMSDAAQELSCVSGLCETDFVPR